ncbi:MAG: adenine methyltransferase [Proteobacteria bacterium]|nr:adenine methyltransferase [Pseudomonadota bacterium]
MAGYYPKSKSDKWATPKALYDTLNAEFNFNFDPCPINWAPGDPDGLSIEWGERSFVNPPYSKVANWIEKAHNEWKKGKLVVLLINAITDTKAFHKFINGQAEIRFIRGRVKFEQPGHTAAPNVKPSILAIFRPSQNTAEISTLPVDAPEA